MTSVTAWEFVGEAEPDRLLLLSQPRPALELSAALREGLCLVCYHRDLRQGDPSFQRAVFCCTVAEPLFDWFFNASTGYRGAYFESPDLGSQFNRILLNDLAPQLAAWAGACHHEVDKEWIHCSLRGTSAKVWLAEHPGLCPACAGEWSSSTASDLEIKNGRWENASHVHAMWGRQAPKLTKIRFFGAFIDSGGNEWVAPRKSNRAQHIWEHGWS